MKTNHVIIAACGLYVAAFLVGCGGDGSTTKPVAAAKAALAKSDLVGAKLQLRTALQVDPNSAEARYLLGKTLLREGDFVGAALELSKARDLKFSLELLAPSLARSYLATGEFKKVIDEFGPLSLADPIAAADVLTSVATAHTMQGDPRRAEEALGRALAAAPNSPPALLAKARLRGSQGGAGELTEALALTDAALRSDPAFVDAWLLKGDLYFYGARDVASSIEAYSKALELDKAFMRTHVALITALLKQRKSDEARQQFALLKKAHPGHPQTLFFEAQFALLNGEHKAARELFAQVVGVAADNVRLLTLAGTNELHLGALVQAETFLSKAVSLAPNLAEPRRVLAQVHLRGGQTTKMMYVLKPLLARDDADADTLYLGAMGFLQAGDAARSQELLVRAAKLAPNDPKIGTAAALHQLARGDAESAFAALGNIAAADKTDFADLALIGAHIRRREYDAALLAIEAMGRKLPQQPLVADLRGRVLVAKNDLDGARAGFEQAVKLSPTYFPAVGRLAALDLSAKRPEDARKRIEAVLKIDAKHMDALLALADLRAKAGGSVDEVADLYRQAQRLNPGEKAPFLAWVDHLLANRQAGKALQVAQDALAALPNDLDVLNALGQAQVASGELQQAVSTFAKLSGLQPESVQPLIRLAALNGARGEADSAFKQYRRALDLAPGNLAAQQGLIQIAVRSGKTDVALAVARSMQQQRPAEALGYVFEGDILRYAKKWPAARAAYQSGMGKAAEVGYLATKIHSAWLAEGRRADADRYAVAWLKDQPKDAVLLFHLGMVALTQKDMLAAERQFREVVERIPDHALALNNLAWVTAEMGKPGGDKMIERALALMPDNPDFLDTQSHVWMQAGDTPRAISAMKRVVELAPEKASYRFGLAKLHIKVGDKASARAVLDDLAINGATASDRSEAKRLVGTL